MEEESWRRNHLGVIRRGIVEKESSESHLGGIREAFGMHLGDIWEAFGGHLGGIWEASGRDLGDLGSQGAPTVI